MYCGQLPKLCSAATAKPSPSAATMRPFSRLRRRVGSSIPRSAIRPPTTSASASGSPATGQAATCNSRGSGLAAKPGRPLHRSGDEKRQLGEKDAMLVRHERPDVAAADRLDLLGDAEPPMHRALAVMPG